ncbi:MAG TPA: hypothetical protein H9937_04180 [Candidatus Alistipes stercorigallinarum]|nr:hypothetical protein [Candidatus Alistipes stercorigallinarum]
MDILIKIVAYAFGAVMLLGVLGLVVVALRMIVSCFKEKPSTGSLPWWAFWSALHND